MESQHVIRPDGSALSRLPGFIVTGWGIAAIGYVVFLAANPTLVGNTVILFILNPGLPSGAYWAIFAILLLVLGILRKNLRHTLAARMAFAGYWVLILWLAAAVLARIVTIPVYYVGPDGAVVMRLSGPVAIKLSNGASIQLLKEEARELEERNIRRGFVNRDIRSVIVNDTSRTLRLEEVIYGGGPSYVPRPVPENKDIAPYGELDLTVDVDYFGPDDHPARSVQVAKGSYYGSRRWLTW
jgi:hypothetical protein